MSEPPHGTEVFVGGIPRSATEDQLKVFAEAMGEVHAVVLLKDPQNNEQNRGCAPQPSNQLEFPEFAEFASPQMAGKRERGGERMQDMKALRAPFEKGLPRGVNRVHWTEEASPDC